MDIAILLAVYALLGVLTAPMAAMAIAYQEHRDIEEGDTGVLVIYIVALASGIIWPLFLLYWLSMGRNEVFR